MLTHGKQDHGVVAVVFGAKTQESGGLSVMSSNPEVSLAGLTNHILFPVRGF